MRIYVASSWRNQAITQVVQDLRDVGHFVYDFREDDGEGAAFNWRDIDPSWRQWSPEEFRENLDHPTAERSFDRDMEALSHCEAVLLVLPCGRSAHLELGYAIGARKPTCILLAAGQEPELMYKAADCLCLSTEEVLEYFADMDEIRDRHFRGEESPKTKLKGAMEERSQP